jgi:hypothetical protein
MLLGHIADLEASLSRSRDARSKRSTSKPSRRQAKICAD